jgi:adenosylcobyric acid synthase
LNFPQTKAKALMFQGTGSDVGKSLIVAGLCRAFTRRGLRVRPFKPQNMSNNAAVTGDGGEIGRAQAVQARACGVEPSVHMNPVLLKPQSEIGAQIIVQGRLFGRAQASEYQTLKPKLFDAVLDSFARLRRESDLVLVEGAGSPAEINLRTGDIANMGFARGADVPAILIGDIDRGGVIAQIVGTKAVLDPADAAMIRGFLVNKFRGDPTLFASGMAAIESRTGWRGLGLVPFFHDAARLPAEDAMALAAPQSAGDGPIRIVAPLAPHIANFDDLDPLRAEPQIRFEMVRRGDPLPVCDLVILPGSKATISDLIFMREQGWNIDLAAHVRRGGRVLGLCGGFQMLGRKIGDPNGIESSVAEIEGLGLLDVETVLDGEKILTARAGVSIADGARFEGYEMHMGRTDGPDCRRPILRFDDGRTDGASSPDGRVRGVYAHGLFNHDQQRSALLRWLGGAATSIVWEDEIERSLEGLADCLEAHLDVETLLSLAT